MSIEKYAVIDLSNNSVVNLCDWDAEKNPDWTPGEGFEAVLTKSDPNCVIGGSFVDGVFSMPEPTQDDIDKTKADKLAANISLKESFLSSATQSIVVYQTKLMIGRKLTDKETSLLNSWLDYIDALEAIDAETSDVIAWPASP